MDAGYQKEFSSCHVLIIDDMETMRRLEVDCLRDMGFENVHSARNGEEAWKFLNQHTVDILVCDWDMPQLNGLQLLKRIRSDETYAQMPFLMVTANSDVSMVKQAISDGVTDYLLKPFQPKKLGYRVLKILKQSLN